MVLLIPSLVEVNDKDDVITETGNSMGSRHCYYECKNIIDEGVESLHRKE